MEQYMMKGKAWRNLLRWICFASFGAAAFSNPLDRLNPSFIGFGIVIGLIFGGLFRKFLRGMLGVFNRKMKKEMGKESVAYAIDCAMMYIAPFAAMALISVFYLKWSVTVVFVSAGVMAVGTASALEMGKLRGVQEVKNTISAAIASYLFSFIWTLSAQWLARAPLYIEGGVSLLRSFIAKGGGSL